MKNIYDLNIIHILVNLKKIFTEIPLQLMVKHSVVNTRVDRIRVNHTNFDSLLANDPYYGRG